VKRNGECGADGQRENDVSSGRGAASGDGTIFRSSPTWKNGSKHLSLIVMGLDLSLAATGLVVARIEPTTFGTVLRARHVRTELVTRAANLKRKVPRRGLHDGVFYGDDEDRKDLIVSKVLAAARRYNPIFVGIEGFSMGAGRAVSGKTFTRHESAGAVKYGLNQMEIPWDVVAPTSLKKFATGKGTAEKDEMINTAIGFGYRNIPEGNDDLADAYHAARWAGTFLFGLDPDGICYISESEDQVH
jgi:Holliday junction resolvasome RuvABC endonuclease subunit